MFSSTLLLAAATLCGLVGAQNYSTSGPLSIDPNSVSMDTRMAWCRGQTNNCPLICGGQASPNTCDPTTLTYVCTCTDGSHPNVTNYDAMLPSFICAQWKADCVAAHPNDLSGQTACLSVTCGMANASKVATSGTGHGSSSSSSASSATASSTASKTSSSSSKSTSSSAAVALNLGASYGVGILAVGLAAVFGLAL